ncbi:MAG: efflux RND transporter periplasmic adaptor subunit [Magnetovibrionaceae bacterium]
MAIAHPLIQFVKAALRERVRGLLSVCLATGFSLSLSSVTAQTADGLQVRALLEPADQARVSSEISARITKLPLREGQSFKKGDLLVDFDCRLYRARLKVAAADLAAAKATLANKQELQRLNSTGALDVALAQAGLDRAAGEHQAAGFPVDRCRLRAPFDGRIVERAVNRYETVSPGDPLLSLIAEGTPDVKLVIPSGWLTWLKKDTPFELAIDETGAVVQGSITRVGALIDAVSQSLTVYGRLSKGDQLRPGMSGTARFQPPRTGGTAQPVGRP